jgi:photosystem II stability/assembly factor-like uncharacterized protein
MRLPRLTVSLAVAGVLAGCLRSPVTITPPRVPEGGRALAIAVTSTDAQRLFVTTESGGLFRTFNGGTSWQHLGGLPNFATLDVAVASLAPQIIIATTRSRYRVMNDGGIWRSTDGGGTWTQPAGSLPPPGPACPSRPSAHGISHMPLTRTFYVGTDCGIAVSNDDGATWSHFVLDPAASGSDSARHRVRSLLVINRSSGVAAADRGIFFLRGGSWAPASIPATPGRVPVLHAFAAPWWSGSASVVFHASGGDEKIWASTDGGASWTAVPAPSVNNREAFVRISRARSGDETKFDVYIGDGQNFHRQTFSLSPLSGNGSWTKIDTDHVDPSDVAFDLEFRLPILHASDGGVHRTTNQGAKWTLTGAGYDGFNALQVAEITGQQVTGAAPHLDLYFATQDNYIRASPDGGQTWPKTSGGEGRHLRTDPTSVDHQGTRVTGGRNDIPKNYQAEPHFDNVRAWPSAPNGSEPTGSEAPFLIGGDAYLQPAFDMAVSPPSFDYYVTLSAGAAWSKTFTLPLRPKGPATIAGSPANPTAYQGVERGSFGDGMRFGLLRASNLAGTAAVRRADSLGMGAIGSLRVPIARYVVFGVDPRNQNHLIAPDIQDKEMKFSADGGTTWFPLPQLTQAVTDTGRYLFNISDQSLASVIAWDPYDACSILVGTIQNGIIHSSDGGRTWAPIKGTRPVTWISSFFFPPRGQVWISTNGRGLWRLKLDRRTDADPARCPFPTAPSGGLPVDTVIVVGPAGESRIVTGLGDPAICPSCTVIMVRGGWITSHQAAGDTLRGLAISGGTIARVDRSGREVPLAVPNAYLAGEGGLPGRPFARELRSARRFRGLVLDGQIIRGYIAARDELPFGPTREAMLVVTSRAGPSTVTVAGDSIVVSGTSFLTSEPVSVFFDGIVAAERVAVRADGTFGVSLPVDRPRGEIVVTAEQRDGTRLTAARTTIEVVGLEGGR